MMHSVCKLIFLYFVLISTWEMANAKAPQRLQILHTNDLHGFLENTIKDPKRGNYAALKVKMDELEEEATQKGMPTLRVDAGDFLEGNMFYLAQRGRRVWDIMNLMDYDAVTIGNHDWLMGTSELETLIKEIPPKFDYLGANFVVRNPLYRKLKKTVKPFKVFEFHGKKLAIMGLTTDELFYSWRFNGGSIKDPVEAAVSLEKRIKEAGVDKIIALTHIGLAKDIKVARQTTAVDLIVGGHSHSALFSPYYQKNKLERKIPIVQSGAHGRWLGRLVVELDQNEGLNVVSYELLPIYSRAKKDPEVDEYIKETREILNQDYGEEYLSEVIGKTEIPLSSSTERITPWTKIVTDALRESSSADISVHSPGFGGATISPGDITREMVFNTYPRVFDLEDRYGWYVWEVDVYGVIVKSILRWVLKSQQPIIFSGVSFDLVDRDNEILEIDPYTLLGPTSNEPDGVLSTLNNFLGLDGKFRVENIRVNGKRLNPFKSYRLALPEGIVVGGEGISQVVNYLLRQGNRSNTTVWEAMNQKVQRMKVIRGHLDEKDQRQKQLERFRR